MEKRVNKDSEELTIEEFTQLLESKKITYREGKPEEWFSTLEENGGSLTKGGIATFTEDDFKELRIPILLRKVLKEWASPQGNNLPKNILNLFLFSFSTYFLCLYHFQYFSLSVIHFFFSCLDPIYKILVTVISTQNEPDVVLSTLLSIKITEHQKKALDEIRFQKEKKLLSMNKLTRPQAVQLMRKLDAFISSQTVKQTILSQNYLFDGDLTPFAGQGQTTIYRVINTKTGAVRCAKVGELRNLLNLLRFTQ